MKREVDQGKTRKALRKLRRAAERAEGEGGPGLTDWEKAFVDGVTTRLEKYGSAFRDPGKGNLDEALSARQAHVTRAIDKKSRKPGPGEPAKPDAKPAPRSTFKQKTPAELRARAEARAKKKGAGPGAKSRPGWTPRVRDINDDPTPAEPAAPKLKVIRGGKAR